MATKGHMRRQLLRLRKDRSSKGERKIGEILKRSRIKFKTRCRVGRYEVDFLIGKLIIESDGNVHQHTNTKKDIELQRMGYITIHISTKQRTDATLAKEIDYLIKANNQTYERNSKLR